MSTTSTKRPHAQALADAEELRSLFPAHVYQSWTIAGSLRRKRPEVGDVEIVIVPAFGEGSRNSLFGEAPKINLFLAHLDSLLCTAHISKAIYGDTGFRWGERYRGVEFRGFKHEFFLTTPESFGSTLAIRTGSADFSKRLVTGLLQHGRRNKDGKVWNCQQCPVCGPRISGAERNEKCCLCQGIFLEPLTPIPVPDEKTYFKLCGVPLIPPEDRS